MKTTYKTFHGRCKISPMSKFVPLNVCRPISKMHYRFNVSSCSSLPLFTDILHTGARARRPTHDSAPQHSDQALSINILHLSTQ